ncbi:MAG: phosphofructokinase [Phycisphaerales bacterium]|nr:MAG: phosphofructokinase [Phycisphaerales bacterium]
MAEDAPARIFTLTLNPAIDLGVSVEKVEPEHKLRCGPPRREPGGGGLNVTRAIAELGGKSTAVFPIGGKTGDLLRFLVGHYCTGKACDHRAVPALAPTRENVIVTETSTGLQYRFNMPGAELSEDEAQACLEALVQGVREVASSKSGSNKAGHQALAVVSGSLPPGVQPEFVGTIIQQVRSVGGRVVVDSSGPALRQALDAGVFMVKPNRRELAQAIETLDPDEADPAVIGRAAVELARTCGITYALVSMGQDGAVLATAEGYAHCKAPNVAVKSATGAGDSMVAAAVLAIERGAGPAEILRDGVAAGAAAAMTPGTELLKKPDFDRLRQAINPPAFVGLARDSQPHKARA